MQTSGGNSRASGQRSGPGNDSADGGLPGFRDLTDWFGLGLQASADSVALRIGGEEWTYAEVHVAALRLATAIQASFDGAPTPVGILASRSIECYAGILGAIYAGAAVVPMNPAFPPERTMAMVRAAGLRTIVADRNAAPVRLALADELRDVRVVTLDTGSNELARPVPAGPGDIAYILFTSGSTGRPKGVPITHANMTHFLEFNRKRYDLTPADTCSQTFDCTFDLAMFDLFCTWSAGATLVSTPPQAFRSLPAFVGNNGITFWFSVPTAISVVRRCGGLGADALPSLRWSLFCGEPLTQTDARDWQQAAPGSIVENLYGPTELTIACSAYRWDRRESPRLGTNGLVPVGELYPALRGILIADTGDVSTVEGELCVSGPQMFHGYLDPDDDRERFLSLDGVRWYRTGDRMRVIGPEATHAGYAYLGRSDHQVKIRGYRVELAELEWHARSVPGVEGTVMIAVTDRVSRRIFAWYTGKPGMGSDIRDHLARKLPEFMVPHWSRHLDSFPLNSNRKVDRGALARMAQRVVDGDAVGRPG